MTGYMLYEGLASSALTLTSVLLLIAFVAWLFWRDHRDH